ncbi:FUSC family protein [Flavobacteriaceae bacterium]|nr:FUSC family protein [Flavobacteriaceae bacterium]
MNWTSIFAIPNWSSQFYIIRSIRLSIAISVAIAMSSYLNLEGLYSFALFISPLLMAISDMVTDIKTRVKMLLVVWLGLSLMTLGLAFLDRSVWALIIFILVLVRASFDISFFFPPRNMFFTIILLGFSFFLPLNLEGSTIGPFLFWIMMGAFWYLFTLFIGYLTYSILEQQKEFTWANFFYIDAKHGLTKTSDFLVGKTIAKQRRAVEIHSDRLNIFSHPYRLAISMIIAYLLSLNIEFQNSYWIMMTVILIHNPSNKISAGLPKIFKRFTGTLLGLLIMAGLLYLNPNAVILYLLIAFCAFMIFLSIRDNYFVAVIFITVLVLSSLEINQNLSEFILYERFIDTIIAISIVLGAHAILSLIRKLIKKLRSY